MSEDSYFDQENIIEFISDAKIYDAMPVIGFEGGDFYGIAPYFSCYVLFEEEQAHHLIKKIYSAFSAIF